MSAGALVSCLMVTLPSPKRLAFLRRALGAYCAQSHARRELVIVLDQGPAGAAAAIRAHIEALGRDDIRIVDPAGPLSLGALRNLSRESAAGEVHCQWDDDDLHHPTRIARQLAALDEGGGEAVCLSEVMQYFPAERTLYWTDWRATEPTVMPSTLMCRAQAPFRYAEAGPTARLNEDTDVCVQLLRRGGLRALAGSPQLLVYVSHGANTCSQEHHAMLAERLGLSRGLLRRREATMRADLAAFDFGQGAVSVRGPNGAAFSIGA